MNAPNNSNGRFPTPKYLVVGSWKLGSLEAFRLDLRIWSSGIATFLLATCLVGFQPKPVRAQQADSALIRICAGGDVLLGNNLDTLWAGRASARVGFRVPPFPNADSLLAPLGSLVTDADLVLLNIEGLV